MANKDNNYQDQLIEKIRENYLSIALGLLVLLVAVSIVFRANDSMISKKTQEAEEANRESQKTTTYVVKLGDSVSSIARDQLGSMDHTQAIIDANNLQNPETIEVGQELVLPNLDKGEVAAAETEATTTQPEEAMTGDINGDAVTTTAQGSPITGNAYTVQKGDTLFNITVRAYNDSKMMNSVMRANGIWNPNRIEAGMTLKLPR